MQAVADRNDSEIAAWIPFTEEPNHLLHPSLHQHSALIRGRSGGVDGAGLSHLNGVGKLEDSLVNFMTQKVKQAKLTDLFRAK